MNSRSRKIRDCACLIIAGAVCLSGGLSSSQGALTLADHGKTRYQIVISTNALPSERYAAEELQRYLKKISGVTLPIANDAQRPASREIILGDNAHLRRLGTNYDLSALGTDGFILRTDRNRLVIAGGKPRGTLYGVYELLEQILGVRWFTPELETVPQTSRLLLPMLNETHVPALEYREVYWTEMLRDADFAARHRLNGDHYRLTEKHGGRAAVYFPFVHSMDNLIPRELYARHPEYFPLINGRRVDGYVQRCLSNPDVLKLAIMNVRRWIKEHPDANIISVSQNDTANWCQCDKCKALDDAEGSPSASLLRFVNAIAADIEADYPQVRIDTLAYQYTRKPPKTIRPRANVIVRLCSIECCFAHPLETCISPENRSFRGDILAWEPVAPKLYVWDYTPNFGNYQQPFPNFAALQPNVRFFVGHGVRGLFEQGNYSSGGNGELGPLRAYVLAELLWNPETDVQNTINEFLQAYYGNAGPKLTAYLQLLEAQVSAPGTHAHIYDPPTAPYLNETFVHNADAILAEAEQAAENDTVRFRVQVARLPVWYVQIVANHVTGEARAALIAHFLEIARKAGISNISEGQSLEAWAKAIK
ncbi:MAG TPA: DUF4838 domain-containing protein [Verrucomicrobiae bacterium]|nr:DUF4838 domain-containing protein [Verrucomicrobiae bacterium]